MRTRARMCSEFSGFGFRARARAPQIGLQACRALEAATKLILKRLSKKQASFRASQDRLYRGLRSTGPALSPGLRARANARSSSNEN